MQDTNTINLLFALVGVLGTGIGLLAGLALTEFTKKRDNSAQVANLWELLEHEVTTIKTQLTQFITRYEQDPDAILIVAPLPTIAWQVALTNGIIVVKAQKEYEDALHELESFYIGVAIANRALDQYHAFISNPIFRSIMGYPTFIKGNLETILNIGKSLVPYAPTAITEQKGTHVQKTESYQHIITLLICVGLIGSLAAVFITVYLAVTLFRHGLL